VGWAERLTVAVGLVSTLSFAVFTTLSPDVYRVLTSMLIIIVSVVVFAELRVVRELKRLESMVEELLRALERG
jgi:hypothetical protein